MALMFDGFETTDFPRFEDLASLPGRPTAFVYGIFWQLMDGPLMPFYVGQTQRLSERMEDYCTAQFMASTDFKVGEAIRYLRDTKSCRITLRYKPSDNAERDERDLIRSLHLNGVRLLNDLGGYEYQTAKDSEERDVVQRFCDSLLRNSN